MHSFWRKTFFLLLGTLLFISGFSQIDPLDVTIYRDNWGVPHIHGKTDADAIYGLAWACAEDDFYDMQLNMLMARGRQGEVLGKEGAIVDFATQLLRAREQVEARIDTDISPSYRLVLNAYVQAINTYAEAHPEEHLLKGLFPVTDVDVLVGYVMSTALMSGLAPSLINILEGRPEDPSPYALRTKGKGSNGFAFNSRRTADGGVYLANNSHQPLKGPSSWYEAHIMSDEGLNCHGGLFPGGASIFAGANPNLAWMHTVNLPDIVDVYELEMHPKNKLQYKFGEEWKSLEMRKVKLKVKLGPVKLTIRKKAYWSVYGPTMKKKGKYYSLRSSALHTIKSAEQWFAMNKAENFTEFYNTLRIGGLPSLNIIYADRQDTIFYTSNALYPRRKSGYDWKGVLKGNTPDNLWTEFHPVEDMPQVLCPASGYVFNTNNTPFNSSGPGDSPLREDFPVSEHNYQVENNRSIRFQQLVGELDKVSWDDFLRIKYDAHYPDSMYIYFMDNPGDIFNMSEADYPDIAGPIRLLKEWDRDGSVDNEGAGFFVSFFYHFAEEVQKEHQYFRRNHYSMDVIAKHMRATKNKLQRKFGTWKPPLGEVQRLFRGEDDLPVGGLPDVLRAMNSKDGKGGRRKAWLGDSYIQLVRFSENGLDIYSTNVFGASNHEDSPHFRDQMDQLYLQGKTKHYRLEMDWVKENAVQEYHPGE